MSTSPYVARDLHRARPVSMSTDHGPSSGSSWGLERPARSPRRVQLPTLLELAALAAVVALAGCDTAYSEFDPRCDPAQDTAQVAGTWTIHGSGRRMACDDERWNTDHFELASVPLEITQQGDLLSLDSPPEGGSTFQLLDASVSGRCVWFTTVERGDYGQVRYDFRGAAAGSHSVAGEISGEGPGTCHIEGTFSVDIR